MILTDEEVEARLNSDKNLVVVLEKKNGGRTAGATNIPASVRELIAITANKTNGTQKEIAEEFGVDPSSVSEIKKGLVGGRLDGHLAEVGKNAAQQKEDDAHSSALDALLTTISVLQPKLVDPEIKATDLSKIASNMAKVASSLKPKESGPSTFNNTQVILMRPQQKTLNKYDFVEVS
jgi:predicted transcriptional regulator